MSPVESWLLDNAVVIGGMVVVALMAWSKVSTIKDTQEALESHKKDLNPHPACSVHQTVLDEINKKLDRIDTRVYRLIGGKGNGEGEE